MGLCSQASQVSRRASELKRGADDLDGRSIAISVDLVRGQTFKSAQQALRMPRVSSDECRVKAQTKERMSSGKGRANVGKGADGLRPKTGEVENIMMGPTSKETTSEVERGLQCRCLGLAVHRRALQSHTIPKCGWHACMPCLYQQITTHECQTRTPRYAATSDPPQKPLNAMLCLPNTALCKS